MSYKPRYFSPTAYGVPARESCLMFGNERAAILRSPGRFLSLGVLRSSRDPSRCRFEQGQASVRDPCATATSCDPDENGRSLKRRHPNSGARQTVQRPASHRRPCPDDLGGGASLFPSITPPSMTRDSGSRLPIPTYGAARRRACVPRPPWRALLHGAARDARPRLSASTSGPPVS
jgi:hypothetical protein